MEAVASDWAELILIDVGPNPGAISRSALIASDSVCLPLAPDLYSLQGLKDLGPTLKRAMFPTENRRDFAELPAEIIDKLQIEFYSDPSQAAFKALLEP